MKYLKRYFLLFIFIIFFSFNVNAEELDITSSCKSPISNNYSTYGGLVNSLQTGNISTFNFNTRYNGKLSFIGFDIYRSFSANTTYTITLNMETSDFRNKISSVNIVDVTNSSVTLSSSVRFVSMLKVQVTFTTISSSSQIYVFIGGGGIDYITGVSNWNLKNVLLDTSSESNGTNEIIDNNNSNTQQIIDNQNNLLTNKCTNLLGYNNYYRIENTVNVNATGDTLTLSSNNTWAHIDYEIPTEIGKTYYVSGTANSTSETALFWVGDTENNFENRYYIYENNGSFSGSFTATTNLTYVRLYASKTVANTSTYYKIMFSEKNTSYCEYGSSTSNKIDDVTNSINDTNDYLKDDSNPTINDNDFLTTFNSIGLNDPLSYLLTLPTQLINKIVSLSSSCTSINLGTLYGVMLTMPCINLENILGSTIWNIIDVIFSVSLLVVILKNLYDTFSNLLTMGAEKEAKEKFSMPTPMDFLAIILGGDR